MVLCKIKTEKINKLVVWYKANPSFGHTIQIDRVCEAFEQAKQDPADEALFMQLRLNFWLKQEIRWMPMDTWNKCAFEVDPEKLKDREYYGGLDLSNTNDIKAFVLLFPPVSEEDKFYILPYFWIHKDNMRLGIRCDRVPNDVWRKSKRA